MPARTTQTQQGAKDAWTRRCSRKLLYRKKMAPPRAINSSCHQLRPVDHLGRLAWYLCGDLRVRHALGIGVDVLEGVERHVVAVACCGGGPWDWCIAMVLHQQLPLVFALHAKELQALVHPYILAPLAVALAQLVEMGLALVSGGLKSAHRVLREDLDRTVHAVFAIVEIDPVGRLHVMCENGLQAVRKKHSIRIHFDGPLVD